jgi:Ca2+-transporting ATPase
MPDSNSKQLENLWHALTKTEALKLLETTSLGLSPNEAADRLARFGENKLTVKEKISTLKIFFAQFKNILVIILILAAFLSAFLGHYIESFAVFVIVIFSAVLGFVQEYRAEKSLEALQDLALPKSLVVRDGKTVEIFSSEMVPGDILVISAGNKISADVRLLESVNLQIEEGALTGESLPSQKEAEKVLAEKTALGDRLNMAYTGTSATYGRGLGLVVATGMSTELGKIAGLLSEVKQQETPLKINLDSLAKKLGAVALVVVALIVALGIIRQESLVEMLLFGVSLAVAVVPEALPAVVTVSLALGATKMAKRNALVRNMPVVETLGSTTVICTDKTGTLTKDEMTVKSAVTLAGKYKFEGSGYEPKGEVFFDKQTLKNTPEDLRELLSAGILCSDAILVETEGQWGIQGDATEGALLVAGLKSGLSKEALEDKLPRLEEIPFSSEAKYMATLHKNSGGTVVYAKGAIEVIMGLSNLVFESAKHEKLTENHKKYFMDLAESYARLGQRVIALAKNHTLANLKNSPKELVFLGLVAMADSLREEAKAAVNVCQNAGIRTIMITGDHPATAAAIAAEVGIIQAGEKVLSGLEIESLGKKEFSEAVGQVNVYARVSPEHKLRIVEELQNQGQVVAMTGDGVNDAPALKRANVGVAMGIKGTDVSKEAAAMTLLDDNFASIVAAVEEGRIIFENIKKYLIYLLSAHVGEVFLIAGAVAFGWPLPLTAVQILYVNLASDGPPALALAAEKGSPDNMFREPRDLKSGVFTKRTTSLILVAAIWTTLLNFLVFFGFWTTTNNLRLASTATFLSLIIIQLFKAFSLKSDRLPFYSNMFNNVWLNWAVIGQIPLLWAISSLDFFQKVFFTTKLKPEYWLAIIILSLTIVPVLEAAKKILNFNKVE